MATNTKNLALLKKDATTEGNDTFNIKSMLNDNWDKIDTAWPNKANATDLTSHTGNTTVHVTAAERIAWNAKANASHTHTISDVTSLQTTLDGKANASHTHTIANVTNLQSTLDGKASSSHNHTIADVTSLQATLDGKAPTSHTHTIANVTNLQTTLDGKAPTSHTHTIANVTNLQTTLDSKASAVDLITVSDKVSAITGNVDSYIDGTLHGIATLQHGSNIVESKKTSPANIEVQGHTLISLGNTALEVNKKYVLADKKTSLKWADASTVAGVAKFSGKAEKPTIIRVANFENKVSGSVLENPHNVIRTANPSLWTPSSNLGAEFDNTSNITGYNRITKLDNNIASQGASSSGQTPQHIFSFNLIEEVGRNIGKIPGSTTAEKVQWLKNNVSSFHCNWYGYGSNQDGNKVSLCEWSEISKSWGLTYKQTHTSSVVSKLRKTISNAESVSAMILSDGFIHFVAYAEPSNGTTTSTINTDYVELEIELKPTAVLNNTTVPLYEVNDDEYGKILSDWNEEAVLTRYPKVENVQHLQGIALFADGANLLPPFTEWTLHANAKVVSPYELELNATATDQKTTITVNAEPLKTYTLSIEQSIGGFNIYSIDENDKRTFLAYYTKTRTFETLETTKKINIEIVNGTTTGKLTFKNPTLTLSKTAKPFVPYSQSKLYADVQLGQIGTVKDMLYKHDGRWLLRKAIEKDVEFTDNLDWGWSIHTSKTGCKVVKAEPPANISASIEDASIRTDIFATKHNGKVLKNESTSNMWYAGGDPAEKDSINIDEKKIILMVPNADTGFAESYAPTPAEVRAYLNGWKVKSADSANKPNAWVSIVDGKDAPTQALNYVMANKAPGHTRYKLSYVLATPEIIDVTDKVEGDILVNGSTQIAVNSGVVVREKASPFTYSNGFTYINDAVLNVGSSKLSNKTLAIIAVYKNGVKDTKWKTDSINANGKKRLNIQTEYFDTTAEYTVTYEVLEREKYTTSATEISLSYADSTRSSIDDLAVNQNAIYEMAQGANRHTSTVATTTTPGHVRLSNVISTDQTTAITPKAVDDALHDIKDNVNTKASQTELTAVSAKVDGLETSDNLINIENGWEVGTVTLTKNETQAKLVSPIRARYFDNPIPVEAGATYSFSNDNANYALAIHELDKDMIYIVDSGWITDTKRKYKMSANTKFIRFLFRNNPDGTATSLDGVKNSKFSLVKGDIYQAWKPSQQDAYTKIDSIGTRTTKTETDIATLKSADTTITGKVTAVETRVTKTETDITALKSADTTTNGNVTAVTARVATAETNITSLKSADTTITGNVTAVANRATALETRATTAESNIAALKTADTTITGNVTAVANRATALETRATTAESNITALKSADTTITNRIAVAETKTGNLSTLTFGTKKDVATSLNELFQYADDGKRLIKEALTNIGAPIYATNPENPIFGELAVSVRKIIPSPLGDVGWATGYDEWYTNIPPRPIMAANAGSEVVGGNIYILSGKNLHCYNPKNNTWTEKTPPPYSYYDAIKNIAVVDDRYLHVIGGREATSIALSRHLVYDSFLDTWTVKAAPPFARYGNGVIYFNGYIYSIGGYQTSSRQEVYKYNPVSETWTQDTNFFVNLYNVAPFVYKNGLYVYYNSYLYTLSSSGSGWVIDEVIPSATRYTPAVTTHGNKLYAFSNSVNNSSITRTDVYNFNTFEWSLGNKPLSPTTAASHAHNIDGKIYMVTNELIHCYLPQK